MLTNTLREASRYYLLAWQPAAGAIAADKYRKLVVRIKDRPKLTVLVQRGFFDQLATAAPIAGNVPATLTIDADSTSGDQGASRKLPVALYAGYAYEPGAAAPTLTAALEIDEPADATQPPAPLAVDVAIEVRDEAGEVVTGYTDRLSAEPSGGRRRLVHGRRLPIKAGLYRVRLTAREAIGKRVASVIEWIEAPELRKRELALSSIFLLESVAVASDAQATATNAQPAAPQPNVLKPARRFSSGSPLRFLINIYAPRRDGDVLLTAQIVRERDDQVMLATPQTKLPRSPGDATTNAGEHNIVPLDSQLPLRSLAPGRYRLRIDATVSGERAGIGQSVSFVIE